MIPTYSGRHGISKNPRLEEAAAKSPAGKGREGRVRLADNDAWAQSSKLMIRPIASRLVATCRQMLS